MVGKAIMQKLYDYNYWANAKIMESAAQLTEEQLHAPSEQSHGSLHELLFHTMRTEWLWRTMIQTQARPANPLRSEDFVSLESIRQRWQAEEQAMRTFLAPLDDTGLAATVTLKDPRTGEDFANPAWQLLLHAALHSMQHRSEAATILTRYGQSPGNIDFVFFM